jgi:hypothetical protein
MRRPSKSQYSGYQHLFTADEGTFYVSEKVGEILADQFRKLGVQPGDRIELCKAEVGRGPEKRTQWQVSVDSQNQPQGKPVATGVLVVPKVAPAPATELERQLATTILMVEERKSVGLPPLPWAAEVAQIPQTPRWAQQLEQQTKHVVDVYAALVNYASAKHGNAVKPEDIRALMTTVFINLSKGSNSNAA